MATRQSNTDTIDTLDGERDGNFLTNNLRQIVIAAVAVLLIVGGVMFFRSQGAEANEEAAAALSAIRPYYDRGEYESAVRGDATKTINGQKIRGLQSIVEEWGSTSAGKVAALLLGNSYMAMGQPAKAAEPFETAARADDDLVVAPAHAGLAEMNEAAGKFEAAAKEFEEAASHDHVELNTPQYLLGAARNYERAGKNDAATENYRKVATQFPQSPANAQARLALARHNVEL
ncbi:MAG: tetratricopeptide repeat protein [Bacteroidetes bacterium]|nr:tetratricopeptide repeat protein [Bacteroidota bacterium]